MVSPPPDPAAPQTRLLTAIVFTDVASFSARMEKDETATLRLLARDFATMRAASAEQSGTVLKTTGDGLLLRFSSAVQAVTWALQVQRYFAEQAKSQPVAETLRHRVGIHLGDVWVTASDVMGDGVNMAARVQAQAPAGGICISQVVYDVVKNRLKLDVARLEPRKLKNIAEAVQMYHVLLEPRAVVTPVAARPAPRATLEPAGQKSSKMAFIVSGVAILALAGGLFFSYLEHERDMSASKSAQAALEVVLSNRDSAVADAGPPAAGSGGELGQAAVLASLRGRLAQATTERPAVGAPGDEPLIRAAEEVMSGLDAWVARTLPQYTAARSLLVRRLGVGSAQPLTVFWEAGQVVFEGGGAQRKRPWENLSRPEQAAVILGALRHASPSPDPALIAGAQAFAFVHHLPEMARILLRDWPVENAKP